MEDDSDDSRTGTTIGGDKYRLGKLLGRGAVGSVYKAEFITLGLQVAVKILPEVLSSDPAMRKRFHDEARAAIKISHPNVVRASDFGEDDGRLYYVMEWILGDTLRVAIQEGPMPTARVVKLGIMIARGLEAAHALGVIHRDLKPENIMLVRGNDGEEVVKILDFGIAKQMPSDDAAASKALTHTGTVFGTPYYMSPEQADGRNADVDQRSDVYALGAILHEMQSGKLLFQAMSPIGVLAMHLTQIPTPLRQIDSVNECPPEFEAIVLRCLKKNPKERFQTVSELLRELERVQAEIDPEAAREISGPMASVRKRHRAQTVIGVFSLLLVLSVGIVIAVLFGKSAPEPSSNIGIAQSVTPMASATALAAPSVALSASVAPSGSDPSVTPAAPQESAKAEPPKPSAQPKPPSPPQPPRYPELEPSPWLR